MYNYDQWLYNPNYINQQMYYQQQAEIQRAHEANQQIEIFKAQKALNDFLDAVKNVDGNHQQELYFVCLAEIAKRNGW